MALRNQQTGISSTFRRGADIDTLSGPALIKDHIKQVIGTRLGELPWNPLFGSRIHTLQFLPNDDALGDAARAFVIEALTTWLPSIQVVGVGVTTNSNASNEKDTLSVRIQYRERVTGNTGSTAINV